AAILGPQSVFVATKIGRSFAPLGEKPHGLLGLAEVLPFRPAVFTKTTGDRTDHDDTVADAKVLDIRADLDDLAQSIVADGHRQIRNRLHLRAVLHGVFAHVQVAVIESGAQHANQHLAGADIRNRHVIDADDFAGAVRALEAMQTGGFHRALYKITHSPRRHRS